VHGTFGCSVVVENKLGNSENKQHGQSFLKSRALCCESQNKHGVLGLKEFKEFYIQGILDTAN
jgi:hypothetical protein